LQSTYAAETQFLPVSAFSEEELRGRTLVDVKPLTACTAKLGVSSGDSPATTTRSSKRVSSYHFLLLKVVQTRS